MSKLKVQLRNGFSDRNMIKEENKLIQIDNFDVRTRVALNNAISLVYSKCYSDNINQSIIKTILANAYCVEIKWDQYYNEDTVLGYIKETIREDSYDDVLTIIEYFITLCNQNYYGDNFCSIFNNVFEQEYVGYRFVNNQIVPITDEIEIKAIEDVNNVKVDVVKDHINKSLSCLSDRNCPDYENSIKESISAVEAMCNSIAGKGTLGQTLNKLEKNGVYIHGALKKAFSELYGWTSDGNGIRHAGNIDSAKSTFDEAKFMLITCSAFINYLKSSIKD